MLFTSRETLLEPVVLWFCWSYWPVYWSVLGWLWPSLLWNADRPHRSQSAARLEAGGARGWSGAPGNSRPAWTAAGTRLPLKPHTHTQMEHLNFQHWAERSLEVSCSGIRCVCTCGGVRQETQMCLSQAAAVLCRQLVNLWADSFHWVFGDGSDMRTTLLSEVLQTVLHTHTNTHNMLV